MKLVTERNLSDVDGVYQQLIAAHQGLGDEESAAFNCRLILVLLNHIGDANVIAQALQLAGRTAGGAGAKS